MAKPSTLAPLRNFNLTIWWQVDDARAKRTVVRVSARDTRSAVAIAMRPAAAPEIPAGADIRKIEL
jgi:hypothetical protein